MALHKRKSRRKQKLLPKYSIQEEREKHRCSAVSSASASASASGALAAQLYNGLTEEEFIAVAEEEPVFGHRVLGLRVLSIAPGVFTTVMPFKDYFTGNFVTGVQHGGVTASLVDQTAGMCARSVVQDPEQRVSTVNFSIDYLAPAPCFEHIICEARVVSGQSEHSEASGGLIFVDAVCWNESRTVVIGVAKLTFNVYTRKS
jgi:uncharacterized protein (TIGR00369 family)